MERRERKNAVTVLAPAKLNLALDVVGLLPNGYHALDMTMQTITLYERVMLRRSAGLSLRLPGSLVQPNDKNTAIKAALAFFHYTGLLAGVDITIYKNTPGKGLRGGHAVVRHHHREPALRHRRQRLEKIAHTLHPCGGVRRIPGRRGRTGCCTGRKAALEAGVRGAA